MTANSLTTIQFHGASLIAQRGDTPETTLVAMKPVVEGMGLAWSPQFVKLKDHPVLAPAVTQIVTTGADGKSYEMTAVPLNRLHFWLATVNPKKVPDPVVREKVIIYQTEVADTLFDKFFGRALSNPLSKAELGRQTAAIIEDKLGDFIARMLPSAVAGYIASHNLAIADGMTAGEVCDLSKVCTAYPRGVSARVSKRLQMICKARGVDPQVSRLGRVRALLFPTHIVREWLDAEGRALINRWVEERKGQLRLRLVK